MFYFVNISLYLIIISGDFTTLLSISGENAFEKRRPGIIFTEKMVGTFSFCESRDEEGNTAGKREETPCEFTLTIESTDLKSMLEFDPDHDADISGTVTCPALSSAPMKVSEGQFLNALDLRGLLWEEKLINQITVPV